MDKGLYLYKVAGELEGTGNGRMKFSTRGRNGKITAAACLYIACLINKEPYMLVDFSDAIE